MMLWTRDIMLHRAMNVLSITNICSHREMTIKWHEGYLNGS